MRSRSAGVRTAISRRSKRSLRRRRACRGSAWATWADPDRIRIARSHGSASRTSSACRATTTTRSATTNGTAVAATSTRAIANTRRSRTTIRRRIRARRTRPGCGRCLRRCLIEWRRKRILLVHGSPDSVSEFVWESETDDARIDAWLATENVQAICATHSGLPWVRTTPRGFWCNVGVLGRPAHDETPRVGFALLHFGSDRATLIPSLVPLVYDVAPVAAAIRAEGLPDAFAQALERGVWTTCANILRAGRATAGGPLRGARRPLLDPDVSCTRRCPCSSRLTSRRSSATRSIRSR